MKPPVAHFVEHFLRTCLDTFTTRDFVKHFASMGIRMTDKQALEYILNNPYVYQLEDKSFVTRAGMFTGAYFSIKPTAQEVAQGLFVVGDRCLPFVDEELLPSELIFCADTEELSAKVGVFDSDFAIDVYQLFGEEYAPQYIASDPANAQINFVDRNFELPATVSLTGFDLEPLVRRFNFTEGDRLLCHVIDWDLGIVGVQVQHAHNDVFDTSVQATKRLEWYAFLEQCLLNSFSDVGPCMSIGEQLEVVFVDQRDKLCVPDCGSVEEYVMRYARKVGLEHYGVETRLWHKGKEVPAIGSWNDEQMKLINEIEWVTMEMRALYTTPDCVYDEFLRDMYFCRKDDLDDLLDYMFTEDFSFSKAQRNRLLLHINERNAILSPCYNWFADQKKGPVRHDTLELYRNVSALAFRIECSGGALEKYPQQELVILSQLNGHLMRMISTFETDEHIEQEADALMLSLEGMRCTFEDIEGTLESAFESQRLGQFKVRK
ncbi:MAG: hypothetical protein IIT68_05000 [Treponema sp.]|nr:hypothetical protein [Treponema sp.]